jgi:ribose 1,5-bisphosphokinase
MPKSRQSPSRSGTPSWAGRLTIYDKAKAQAGGWGRGRPLSCHVRLFKTPYRFTLGCHLSSYTSLMAKGGRLFLVVGPSGVGKDALISGAQAALAGYDRWLFPAREVTRTSKVAGDRDILVDAATFRSRRASGVYALHWWAHGHGYGVPRSFERPLQLGRNVVLNVSRSVLGKARSRYPSIRVISLTADTATLQRRLEARGREAPVEITKRIRRAHSYTVTGADVQALANDGDVSAGVQLLLKAMSPLEI